MHEQSETVQRPDGRWINVYGRGTPRAGQPLDAADFATVDEAVSAAVARSAASDGWQSSRVIQPAPSPSQTDGWRSSPVVGNEPARIGPVQDLTFAEQYVAPALEWLGNAVNKGKAFMPQPVQAAVDVVSNPRPIVQGMADPAVGAFQLAANATGFGDKVNPAIQAQERAYQTSRGADEDSFDLARTVASVVNPLPIKAAAALKPAATMFGRTVQGAGVGGATAATMPVYEADFWGGKGAQAGTGTVVGGAFPLAAEGVKQGVKAVANVLEPRFGGGVDRVAGRTVNEIVGTDKLDDVIASLEADKRFVARSAPTAGEAAVPAGSTSFAGMQRILEPRRPDAFYERDIAQNQARRGAVREVGRDKAALEAAKADRAANAAENYNPIRDTKIDPRAQTQIMEDAVQSRTDAKNVALQDKGRFDTFAAQQENLGNDWTPVPGMPRVPARVSEFPERVAEGKAASSDAAAVRATRAKEEKFLRDTMESLKATVGLDDVPLSNFLKRPSMEKAVDAAIRGAEESRSYFPKPGEKFSIENLQRMKIALDNIIRDPAKHGLQGVEDAEIKNTRDAFVRWLNNRSPEWKAARLQYAEDSVPINQMEVGQYLEKKLESASAATGEGARTQRSQLYSEALRDAPRTIKSASGRTMFDDFKSAGLTDEQITKVEGVAKDLARSADYDEMAKRGVEAARKVLGERLEGKNPLPPLIERTTTLINAIVRRIEGKAGEKAKDRIAELLLEPKELARIMRAASEQERNGIIATIFGAAEKASAPLAAVEGAASGKGTGGEPPKKPKSVPDAPRNANERVVGAIYRTPKGDKEWSENGWLTPRK